MIDLIDPGLDAYIKRLLPARDSVLAEMEAYAAEHDVPIVGPAVGTLLQILTRSIGADRVFELGSAIGYSTAFFAQAVGRGGQVFYTDGDPAKAELARGYLQRMDLLERVSIKVGDAVRALEATTGYFDAIFIDVDKEGYPAALRAAAPRVRRGGYLLADNVLWSGKVIDGNVDDPATDGIRQFNETLFSLEDFRSVIVPLRDGVAIARRE